MNCIIIKSYINDSIAIVKLNHDITRNLPMDVVNIILFFTYKFKHQEKFQPVLRDIENGRLIVLKTLGSHSFWFSDSLQDMFYNHNRWKSRMHPEYANYDRYEGASRYLTPFDVIYSSKKLKNQRRRCKYQTINEMVALIYRKNIYESLEYDIEDIELDGRSESHPIQRFNNYFLRK